MLTRVEDPSLLLEEKTSREEPELRDVRQKLEIMIPSSEGKYLLTNATLQLYK